MEIPIHRNCCSIKNAIGFIGSSNPKKYKIASDAIANPLRGRRYGVGQTSEAKLGRKPFDS